MMLRFRFMLLLAEGQVWETLYSLKFYGESIERKKLLGVATLNE